MSHCEHRCRVIARLQAPEKRLEPRAAKLAVSKGDYGMYGIEQFVRMQHDSEAPGNGGLAVWSWRSVLRNCAGVQSRRRIPLRSKTSLLNSGRP